MFCISPSSLCSVLLIAWISLSQTLAQSFKANCAELYVAGQNTSGVYKIDPDGLGAFYVYCNQSAAVGGWTVIQRRLNGFVNFNRSWCDYKHGFGNLNGEFWLGLDKINRLTWRTKNRLRVDLEFNSNNIIHYPYAEYDFFGVKSELDNYHLIIGGNSSGDAGNSLDRNNKVPFSTMDKDMSKDNCAHKYEAWWYPTDKCDCGNSSLNGKYKQKNALRWENWDKHIPDLSATKSEMKIKPDCART